ncbi:MAG: tetratricopeptide repeat protein [Verrucomicrobia bacterium]|nr:tetratricopeptide repeat protein [Verrucomicrobiota bacterium]
MKANADLVLLAISLLALMPQVLAQSSGSAVKPTVVLTIEGTVEFMKAGTAAWISARTNQVLMIGDRLRTGDKSRATVRLSDLSVLRLAESTAIEIEPPTRGRNKPNLKVEVGSGFFHSRDRPQEKQIRTPLVSVAIRGTEFHLFVAQNGRTVLTLIDGEVDLQNELGQLPLTRGEQGTVEPNQAPQGSPAIDAINIIQWVLYYPGILDLGELGLKTSDDPRVSESLAAYEQGDLVRAISLYPTNRIAPSVEEKLYSAALQLAVGQVTETESRLDELNRAGERRAGFTEAIQKVIAAVKFQAFTGTKAPATATEWLAESYYQQSRAHLEEALRAARKATETAPQFGFAWARLAEMEFSFGRTAETLAALEKGLQRSPRNPRAIALKGFLFAAQNKIDDAIRSFDQAISIDGSLGIAWLGRGLCRIRRGDSEGGRLDLQAAAALEPHRAVSRSYLGKAFANANDTASAMKELGLAKQLDPNDPTSWLYSALLRQTENDINNAVADLEKSQELNNNRRVHRSALLLDQDRAVRSANLAGVYRDAGMFDVSVREAVRAVNIDYANYSAHLFLANSYDALRDPRQINLRYETPWLSEFLLANLLAPVGGSSLSPHVSQQEYSKLLERDRFGIVSSTEYFSEGDWIQSAAQFGTFGNSSYALDALYRTETGHRANNDLSQLTLSAKLKQQITPSDSIYFQTIYYGFESGDVAQYYNQRSAHRALRVEENQEPIVLAGYHHEWRPGVHTLLLVGRLHDDFKVSDPDQSALVLNKNLAGRVTGVSVLPSRLTYRSEFEAWTTELQQIWQQDRNALVLGGRYQAGDFDSQSNFEKSTIHSDLERLSFYGYDHWRLVEPFWLTFGLTYDRLTFPANHRNAPLSGVEEREDRVSPKVGFIWTPLTKTTLRGSYTRSLGGVSYDQSFRLEPVQVAGFNQAYRNLIPESVVGSLAGASFETWGLAWDQKFATGTYVGVEAELLKSDADRQLGVIAAVGFPPVISASTTTQKLDYSERNLVITLNQLVGKSWSFGARYRLSDSRLTADFPEIPRALSAASHSEQEATLHQVSLTSLYHHPKGLFGLAEALWSQQSNRGYSPNRSGDDFWQFNVYAGYRFYHRHAELRLGLLNVADQDYRLNPLNLYRELPRERTFTASLRLSF